MTPEQVALLERLANAIGGDQVATGFRHDATTPPTAIGYAHGPGGLLTYPGVDQNVFHTIVGAQPGILAQLPFTPSVYANPVYEVLTGIQDSTGSNKDGVCDDPPIGGLMKACKHWAPFGRYEFKTPSIEVNRLGLQNNRADPMDLRMVGSPLAGANRFTTGGVTGDPLTNEIDKRLFERAMAFHRKLLRQVWQGNPANNTAQGGYKEVTGLDLLIATGYVDAETGVSCPSLASDVKDLNYLNVADHGAEVVRALSYLMRTLNDLADRTGVQTVRWVIAMRPALFYELSAVWPCAYYTSGCNTTASGSLNQNIDVVDQMAMRDAMRSGSYLMIDGRRYEVLQDDGIAEDSNTTNNRVPNPCFSSDIYVIPMSVLGGTAVTYGEYLDYQNASMQSAINMPNVLITTNGPFLETVKQTLWCLEFFAKMEPRLVMRTPWLAGRLNHVVYCPLQVPRQPFPDEPYHVNGGATGRTPDSLYALWKERD